MTANPDEKFIGVVRTAQLLDVSLGTVYNWAKTGRLRAFRSGDKWLFKESDVLEVCRAQQPKPYDPKTVED